VGLTPPPRPVGAPILPPPLYPIENLVFKNQKVTLDGYRFKNCAFVDCTLVVRRGNFRLEECFFQGIWWVEFDGNAGRVVKLCSIVDWSTVGQGLKATVHPNGGVSVS